MKNRRNSTIYKWVVLITVILSFLNLYGCDVSIDINKPSTYSITYDGNGNDAGDIPVDDSSYEEGDTVIILGNTGSLGKTDSAFAGWNTADDGSGANYSGGDTLTMGSADITLYAKWTQNETFYTVTFESNGGSAVNSQSIAEGGTVTEPADPTRSGYNFDGWYSDIGLTTIWNFAVDTVTSDITLYAKWTQTTYAYPMATDSWTYRPYQGGAYPASPAAPGDFEESGGELIFYGDGYRDGARLDANETKDFTNGTLYMKWKANGPSGYYMGTGLRIYFSGVLHSLSSVAFTTDHPFDGSYLISNDTWIFSRVVFSEDGYTADHAYSNYVGNGGSSFHTYTESGLTSLTGFPSFYFGDNYGGTAASIHIEEVFIVYN